MNRWPLAPEAAGVAALPLVHVSAPGERGQALPSDAVGLTWCGERWMGEVLLAVAPEVRRSARHRTQR